MLSLADSTHNDHIRQTPCLPRHARAALRAAARCTLWEGDQPRRPGSYRQLLAHRASESSNRGNPDVLGCCGAVVLLRSRNRFVVHRWLSHRIVIFFLRVDAAGRHHGAQGPDSRQDNSRKHRLLRKHRGRMAIARRNSRLGVCSCSITMKR